MALRRLKAAALGLALSQALLAACSTTGSSPAPASLPPATSQAPNGPTDPTDPSNAPGSNPQGSSSPASQTPPIQAPIQTGPTLGQRATSALNGMLMGAIIGAQAGPEEP